MSLHGVTKPAKLNVKQGGSEIPLYQQYRAEYHRDFAPVGKVETDFSQAAMPANKPQPVEINRTVYPLASFVPMPDASHAANSKMAPPSIPTPIRPENLTP